MSVIKIRDKETGEFIDIPALRGEGGIPAPATAKVGQTIVVKSVDANGRPTEWKAVNLPSGGSCNIQVALFSSNDGGATLVCSTHTNQELCDILGHGELVLAVVEIDHTTQICCVNRYEAGQSLCINVGKLDDWGWNHMTDYDESYADGNVANKTIGNELWLEF